MGRDQILKETGKLLFKPSAWTVAWLKEGRSRPMYWPSGEAVKPHELEVGCSYLYDEKDRILIKQES